MREKDLATQKVVDVLEEEKRDKSNLIDAEARSCLDSWRTKQFRFYKNHGFPGKIYDAIAILRPQPVAAR